MVNGYPLRILEVRTFEQIERFQTDLQNVFRFIQCAEDRNAMKLLAEQDTAGLRAMEEDTFDVITALTGTRELEAVKETCMEEGGQIDMCRAIRELIAEGRSEGRSEGIRSKAEIVARNMFLRGISAEDAAAICEEDIEQVRRWYRSWGR